MTDPRGVQDSYAGDADTEQKASLAANEKLDSAAHPKSTRAKPTPVVSDSSLPPMESNETTPVGRTLFVRNIAYNTPAADIEAMFASYGAMFRFFSMIDSRGMAFVSYFDIRHAQKAKEEMHQKDLAGRKLMVHYSLPKDEESRSKSCDRSRNQSTVLLTFVPADKARVAIIESDLEEIFKSYGEVKVVRLAKWDKTGLSRFVEFYDSRDANKALDDIPAIEKALLAKCFPDASPEQRAQCSVRMKITWDLSLKLREELASMAYSSGGSGGGSRGKRGWDENDRQNASAMHEHGDRHPRIRRHHPYDGPSSRSNPVGPYPPSDGGGRFEANDRNRRGNAGSARGPGNRRQEHRAAKHDRNLDGLSRMRHNQQNPASFQPSYGSSQPSYLDAAQQAQNILSSLSSHQQPSFQHHVTSVSPMPPAMQMPAMLAHSMISYPSPPNVYGYQSSGIPYQSPSYMSGNPGETIGQIGYYPQQQQQQMLAPMMAPEAQPMHQQFPMYAPRGHMEQSTAPHPHVPYVSHQVNAMKSQINLSSILGGTMPGQPQSVVPQQHSGYALEANTSRPTTQAPSGMSHQQDPNVTQMNQLLQVISQQQPSHSQAQPNYTNTTTSKPSQSPMMAAANQNANISSGTTAPTGNPSTDINVLVSQLLKKPDCIKSNIFI